MFSAPEYLLPATRVALHASYLESLRASLTDAALVGLYSRDGVRLDGAGTVACVDDARCTTRTGRLLIPRAAVSGRVDLGNQAATLDGLTKLTILVRMTPQDFSTTRQIIARHSGVSDATSPFGLGISSSAFFFLNVWDGAAMQFPTRATALNAGTEYVLALSYDGTNATATSRAQLGFAAVTGGVVAPTNLAAVGASAPAALAATAATNLWVGASAGGGSPGGAPIDTIAVYIGQALSAAQIDAETASGFAGAHHRYTFDGTLLDGGTVGGWNGAAVGTGLTYCSDDVRWGGIIMGGGAAANPTWDAVNREVIFDGVSQYLKSVGGTLANITQDCGLSWLGTFPAATGADQRLAELGDAAAGGNPVLTLQVALTTGNLLAQIPGIGAATVPAPSTVVSYPGTRILHGRRTGAGTAIVGAQIGANAEGTASTAPGAQVAQSLVVGASRALGNLAGGRLRGFLVYKGDYAGKQQLVNQFGAHLGAAA